LTVAGDDAECLAGPEASKMAAIKMSQGSRQSGGATRKARLAGDGSTLKVLSLARTSKV